MKFNEFIVHYKVTDGAFGDMIYESSAIVPARNLEESKGIINFLTINSRKAWPNAEVFITSVYQK